MPKSDEKINDKVHKETETVQSKDQNKSTQKLNLKKYRSMSCLSKILK